MSWEESRFKEEANGRVKGRFCGGTEVILIHFGWLSEGIGKVSRESSWEVSSRNGDLEQLCCLSLAWCCSYRERGVTRHAPRASHGSDRARRELGTGLGVVKLGWAVL